MKDRTFSKAKPTDHDPVTRMFRRFMQNNVHADRQTCRNLLVLLTNRTVQVSGTLYLGKR